jgi:hypothetical protein
VDYIRKNNPTPVEEQVYVPNADHHHDNGAEVSGGGDFSSDVDFDDLDK